jgi:hypothetical protein
MSKEEVIFLSDLKPETFELEFEGLFWKYNVTEVEIIEMKAKLMVCCVSYANEKKTEKFFKTCIYWYSG